MCGMETACHHKNCRRLAAGTPVFTGEELPPSAAGRAAVWRRRKRRAHGGGIAGVSRRRRRAHGGGQKGTGHQVWFPVPS